LAEIQEVKKKISSIERGIFEHSICPKSRDELLDMRQAALDLKENFINASFMRTQSIEELEDIRFKIVEVELNIHILASEAMCQSTEEDVRRLTKHYESVLREEANLIESYR